MSVLTSNEKNIIKNVIVLSEEYNFVHDKYEPVSVNLGDGLEGFLKGKSSHNRQKVDEAKEKLTIYLKELSDEDVLTVLTTMYIGRDETSNSSPKQQLFDEMQEEFSRTFGTKDIMIKQMVSKMPLGTYLKEGLDFLK